MRRILCCLLLAFIVITVNVRTLNADEGAKPETYITFVDLKGRTYYVTLLGEREDEASAHAILEPEYTKGETDEERAYNAFLEYSLNDEFYFYGWGELERIDEEHDTYSWVYYPPELFKLAVYYPAEDRLYVSEPIDKEGFYSYYAVSADNPIIVSVDLCHYTDDCSADPYYRPRPSSGKTLLNVLIALIETVLAETFIGFLFGYRGKQLAIIVLANIVTQIILNVTLISSYYYKGMSLWMTMFVIGELTVLAAESLTYMFTIGRDSKRKAFIYALLANAVTAALTFLGI